MEEEPKTDPKPVEEIWQYRHAVLLAANKRGGAWGDPYGRVLYFEEKKWGQYAIGGEYAVQVIRRLPLQPGAGVSRGVLASVGAP